MNEQKNKHRKAGRPKGAANKGTELGRKTIFVSTTISGSPQEIATLKQKAKDANKSVSRFVLDAL